MTQTGDAPSRSYPQDVQRRFSLQPLSCARPHSETIVRRIGWCAVQIIDLNKHLAFRAGAGACGVDGVVERARQWVIERRRKEPDYPVSDERWTAQTICSDLIKAVAWDRGDLLPPLGAALIKLTGFEVVLVEGTSDGVPRAMMERQVTGKSLSRRLARGSRTAVSDPARTFAARIS